MAPIVVTATRTPQPLNRVGQSITSVDAAELERRQTTTVAEVLRTLPGVAIARNGGIGGTTSVFIRGAESDQTVALIDGVKINDPSAPGGGFNFGNLLVGNIARIELLRGPSSVIWGSQAIGGVVNIISHPPTDGLTAAVRAEAGSRETGQIVGRISGTAGPLSASAGAGWFTTDGISAFSAARGGRERDGAENLGANLSLSLALGDGVSLDARGWYSTSTVNIDGFPPPTFAFGDVNEETRTRDQVGYGGFNFAMLDGRIKNRLAITQTDVRRRNIARDGAPLETVRAHGRNRRLEAQSIFDIASGWQVTAGIEREVSRASNSSFGSPPALSRSRLTSVYGQLVAQPLPALTLTAGARHDDHDTFGGATTLAASGVVDLGATRLRASYAEGFKAPSLFQLQSNFGNAELKPERSTGWDAGISHALLGGAIEAGVTVFHRTTSDLIVFISCPSPGSGICTNRPFGTYDNVARARAQGLEFNLTVRPVESLVVQAAYTHVDATNRAAGTANFGRKLVRRPSHSASLLVDYRWPQGLETGLTLSHVGASFDTASNSRKVDGFVLADLRLSYPLTPAIELYGRIENLLDEKYEVIFRFGTPGRSAFAGARLRY